MHPNLFNIGPFTIHTYGIFVCLGIFSGIFLSVILGKKEGLNPDLISSICFFIVLSGIIGARILYILANMSYYLERPLEVFALWKGGLIFSGGIISGCIGGFLYIRKTGIDLLKIADILSPSASFGQAIGRIGCFMAGCCYGKETDLPWAVVFTDKNSLAPKGIPLHPTQLYHSLACLIIFAILMLMRKRKKYDGQIFFWYLILHSTQRLLIERFRADCLPAIGQMSVTQFISLIILISAGVAVIWKNR